MKFTSASIKALGFIAAATFELTSAADTANGGRLGRGSSSTTVEERNARMLAFKEKRREFLKHYPENNAEDQAAAKKIIEAATGGRRGGDDEKRAARKLRLKEKYGDFKFNKNAKKGAEERNLGESPFASLEAYPIGDPENAYGQLENGTDTGASIQEAVTSNFFFGGSPNILNPLGVLVNHFPPCLGDLYIQGGPFANYFWVNDGDFDLFLDVMGGFGDTAELVYPDEDGPAVGAINGDCMFNPFSDVGHCTMKMYYYDGLHSGTVDFVIDIEGTDDGDVLPEAVAFGDIVGGTQSFLGAVGQVFMYAVCDGYWPVVTPCGPGGIGWVVEWDWGTPFCQHDD